VRRDEYKCQLRFLADTLAVGSDLLPVMAINHTGDAHLTSMFGAEQFMPESASASLQDVGPTPHPVFKHINEVDRLQVPGMAAGIQPQVERIGQYYRRHLPSWVRVVGPMPMGPLSTAVELRGADFLLDLADDPQRCYKLMFVPSTVRFRIGPMNLWPASNTNRAW